ncbi:efflux RND transporter periplasmic adaptor subunit [Dethiosulfovibrio sp. F2B]|uniref:efflux RND transporter periplasmic adaptor subunit n=1 Tax=Dethiosulfovibrio faecalis TaxID=2720018 RepID=UPI001F2A55D7|nr:efflux RND transporter periplasmic adaptor subunit [Dethiosulfovibrio faecalis]MCF4151075.1 efflux RND transporter periplasmic adaptor subunit [Dethiosulfovibrio faecalis]
MKKLFALVLIAAIGAGIWWYRGDGEKQRISYRTESLRRGDMVKTVSATGTLEAINTVLVGSQVSGNLSEVLVDYNDEVTKGQLLARIDPTLFQANVDKAEAALLTAQADLAEGRASLAHANRALARKKELVGRNLIAKVDLDDAELSVATARASLRALEGKVAQAKASLSSAKTDLAHTEIVSPINGVVTAKEVDEGQTVAASLSAPELFTIAEDLRRMRVEADIDEADIGSIKEGQDVSFTVDAYPSRTFSGKVDRIRLAPTETDNVVTYTVEIGVSNDDLSLYPGMTAEVAVVTDRREDVLMAPSAALRVDIPTQEGEPHGGSLNGSGVLFTLSGDSPVPVPVKTGLAENRWVQVSGEVSEETRVVVEVLSDGSSEEKGGGLFGPGPGRRP